MHFSAKKLFYWKIPAKVQSCDLAVSVGFGPVPQLVFDPAGFVLGLIWLLRKGVYGSRISAGASSAAGLNCWQLPLPGGMFVSRADNAGGSGRGHR